MIVLQNIVWNKDSFFVSEKETFVRTDSQVAVSAADNALLIPQCASVAFSTYMNMFAAKKWRDLTDLSEVFVLVRGHGVVQVRVVGIVDKHDYSYESVIVSEELHLGEQNQTIAVPDFAQYDAIFVQVTAVGTLVQIPFIAFATTESIKNPVKMGACICTFNRQRYLRANLEKNIPNLHESNLNLSFFISNNGDELDFDLPAGVRVEKNRNLGGAGGFARAMKMALDANMTHIILMDDDIELPFETLFRTIRLFEYLKPEKQDVFVSGSMLSAEEKWLQYERNTVISGAGFHHQGHSQDTRQYSVALENAKADSVRGVAGWWYCAFNSKMVRDYGFPLPIFVRGDDIEFSLRCKREIVSLNGICVWHEPFINKYSELMEDYYLPRNMIINALLTAQDLDGLIKVFTVGRVKKHLRELNYPAAQMVLRAAKHVLDGTYQEDAEQLHLQMASELKEIKSSIPFFSDVKAHVPTKPVHRSKKLRKVIAVMVRYGVLSGKKGTALYGFRRKRVDFDGRKEVLVFDPLRQGADLVKLSRTDNRVISREIRQLYQEIMHHKSRLKEELLIYRNNATKRAYWEDLFRSDGKIDTNRTAK